MGKGGRGAGRRVVYKSQVDILKRRRDFLAGELAEQGEYVNSWDQAEHDALCWAIEELSE